MKIVGTKKELLKRWQDGLKVLQNMLKVSTKTRSKYNQKYVANLKGRIEAMQFCITDLEMWEERKK